MIRSFTAGLLRLLTGVRVISAELCPAGPVVYFANHSSHLDFAVIWAALPATVRACVRPVAGRDYWEKTALRRRVAADFFNAVLIERRHVTVASNPLAPMLAALEAGNSLIVFPEGTRSSDGTVQEFKPGLYHLARGCPSARLVPVYLENLSRILPKGDLLPVPLLGHMRVGSPLSLAENEAKADFLVRARSAVLALAHS